jgi:hypothetical protein
MATYLSLKHNFRECILYFNTTFFFVNIIKIFITHTKAEGGNYSEEFFYFVANFIILII